MLGLGVIQKTIPIAQILQSGANSDANSGGPIALTLPSTTRGSTILVWITGFQLGISGETVTVQDGVNGSYTPLGAPQTGAGYQGMQQFALQNNLGGALTITGTFSATDTFRWITVAEIGGDVGTIISSTSAWIANPSGPNSLSVGPPSPNNTQNALVVVFSASIPNSAAPTPTSPLVQFSTISAFGATTAVIAQANITSSSVTYFLTPNTTQDHYTFETLIGEP